MAPGLVGIKSEVPGPDGHASKEVSPGGGALNGEKVRVGSKLNLQVGHSRPRGKRERSVVRPTSLNVIITRSRATVEKRDRHKIGWGKRVEH